MKQRKQRPTPPPPPMDVDEDFNHKKQEEGPPPEMMSPMVDSDDPVYLERHALAQRLQLQSAEEGFVLLKNQGVLPLKEGSLRLNVFGRHAGTFFTPELADQYGVELNRELLDFYTGYACADAAYTGSGYDEERGVYVPQNRTSTGMFGGMGYLDPEPFIGHAVYNEDGSERVTPIPEELLERAKRFSDTAAVVLYRHAGEGADHEKGDERLSEGEAAMLSFCAANFEKVVVILACNSVIDGDFLETDTQNPFYVYTYGGGVYSNNIGHEVLADYDSRVTLNYLDGEGNPAPHCYPIAARRLGACIYTCNNPGDNGAEALLRLLVGQANPSGRLMDEIVLDYDENPVSRCSGGLVFSRESTTQDLYIYGHNYVAYKEGVYLGYKYFETFRPDRVAYPFGYGLSYTRFDWKTGALQTGLNEYGELQFSANVTVTNVGDLAGKDVVELYVMAPYHADSPYHLEKPLVALAAFEKTGLLAPGQSETVTLRWNARDIACYSDMAECYVLEAGDYRFQVAKDAGQAHKAPAASLLWTNGEDIRYTHDEVTGTAYRNLFTGSDRDGWRFDAHGTPDEKIVYLHRVDVDGVPTVAPGTYPETVIVDERTRETTQILDLKTRGLDSYYEMDATQAYFYDGDIPAPTTNAVYRDAEGRQRNFTLQEVNRFLKDSGSDSYHNLERLNALTGLSLSVWDKRAEQAVWDRFLDQLSVNEMLCRFYHCGFDIPSLLEYGVPVAYSADTPGQIGANNKMKMLRTTRYCDTILACTFNKDLCERLGLALGREAAASGENGTSYFYAPGSNLHRSCLSGKNNNYFSEDAYLSGWICGHFLKGLEEGGVNGCLKHFACNDQEISREGLVVFANEQTLRENYFAAFEHALKIGGGKGIMTSLGRVGTVNACGNAHLTQKLLREEWGFDGMVITDGYGVTSYMYNINAMLGGNSGLLCFGNSGNFGENRDLMELYRYYLQYPGRTTAALRRFYQGCMESLLRSHTFRDLYADYDSAKAEAPTDLNWYEGQIGLGYRYEQAPALTYLGIKLGPGEENPRGMMPNTNCKDRGGTIRLDDYGLRPVALSAAAGQSLRVPVSMEKAPAMQRLGLSICYDRAAFALLGVDTAGTVLDGYACRVTQTERGADVVFETDGNLSDRPCGLLFQLELQVLPQTAPGEYALGLLPLLNAQGQPDGSFLDKQGRELSFLLAQTARRRELTGGWSGVYQSVDSAEWWANATAENAGEELADVTLLPGSVTVTA